MSDSCVFCRIGRGEIPARVVFETADLLAFHDLSPQAPIHVLVIPKRHLASLAEAGAEDELLLGRLQLAAVEVARRCDLTNTGFRLVVNAGADAGQSVDHLHLHVLGGRSLTWPPG